MRTKAAVDLYAGISEKAFTAQVIKLARWYKWRSAHFRSAMTKGGRWVTAVQGDGVGFPDLVLLRHKRAIFAELKSSKGKITAEQDEWLRMAAIAGIEIHVWRPGDIDKIELILK